MRCLRHLDVIISKKLFMLFITNHRAQKNKLDGAAAVVEVVESVFVLYEEEFSCLMICIFASRNLISNGFTERHFYM